LIKLKQLISERDWTEKEYDFYESVEETITDVIYEFKNKKPTQKYQYWNVINFSRLYKIWNDFVKMGVVRDEKGIDMIESIILRNISKLHANTILLGHSHINSDDYWSDAYDNWDDMSEEEQEKIKDDYADYAIDPKSGHWRISDYAVDKLFALASKLIRQNDYTQKLYIIDRILNIVHQRSDLASWFVEGGRRSLSKLSDTEQYFEPEPWEK